MRTHPHIGWQILSIFVAQAFALILLAAPVRAYTPQPPPPTATQIEAVKALHQTVVPFRNWDTRPDKETTAAVVKWLAENHPDATPTQLAVFDLKVDDRYEKAVCAPDALTMDELYEPYRFIPESSVRALLAFLQSQEGFAFKDRFENLSVRRLGAARRILPALPEIFAEAVESAKRLEQVNRKKR